MPLRQVPHQRQSQSKAAGRGVQLGEQVKDVAQLVRGNASVDRALTQIWPPAGVYLAALSRRFESSWASRTASPMSHIGAPGSSTDSV